MDSTSTKKWTKEEVITLLDQNPKAVGKALVCLFNRQTADEKACSQTAHHNNMGFNGVDAKFGSSLARSVLKGYALSNKQLAAARKMLKKYAGQLVEVANMKEAAKAAEAAQVAA